MDEKYVATARKLRLAKLEYEVAQQTADDKKKEYESLRRSLCDDMVMGEMLKFQIDGTDDMSGLSFRLETKERWSPVVENKDLLMQKLQTEASDLFTITSPTLSKYIADVVEANGGQLPEEFEGLVKKYDDTHVVVRTVK